MSYTQIQVTCDAALSQLLIAELSMIGYDVFEETDQGFVTSIESSDYPLQETKAIFARYQAKYTFSWESQNVEKINWNEEWEKNYDPVQVDDQVYVRATFHTPKPAFPYEIVIHPKMSFGTGHHDTTYLMLRKQLTLDHKDALVYDFGSGTGILAIMAGLLGAKEIIGNDVDDWCIENANDNLKLNKITAKMHLGAVRELALKKQAKLVLANINKNILLDEMDAYESLLKDGGKLLMSGFYEQDILDLRKKAESLGLVYLEQAVKNRWAMLVFYKPT